jgi:DNA (cytosine-5)-methyltransferase 1
MRFVEAAHPQVFVLENVDRFSKSDEFALVHEEATRQGGMLEGYQLTSEVLLAADYGVAQRRPRTILIGSRVGEIPLPKATHEYQLALTLSRWRAGPL